MDNEHVRQAYAIKDFVVCQELAKKYDFEITVEAPGFCVKRKGEYDLRRFDVVGELKRWLEGYAEGIKYEYDTSCYKGNQ